MAASDAVLSAIARNALRHLLEADDHFKHQRYASALASAIFSIETGHCAMLFPFTRGFFYSLSRVRDVRGVDGATDIPFHRGTY